MRRGRVFPLEPRTGPLSQAVALGARESYVLPTGGPCELTAARARLGEVVRSRTHAANGSRVCREQEGTFAGPGSLQTSIPAAPPDFFVSLYSRRKESGVLDSPSQMAPPSGVARRSLSPPCGGPPTHPRSGAADPEARWREDRRLFLHYRSTGDPAAREAIVTRFLPIVRTLAGRYQHTSEPYEDLVQVGAIGLLKAIERFDVDRSVAFSSFAVPTISGEIKRHFRDRTWIVSVPRSAKEVIQRMPRAERALEAKLGRSPTPQEMAEALGVRVEDVVDARIASQTRSPTPLDASHENGSGRRRGVDVAQEETGFAAAEDAATLEHMLRYLDERDREILRLYVEEDLTQKAIAQRLGLSQMHVSRLMRAAIARLADIHETQSART